MSNPSDSTEKKCSFWGIFYFSELVDESPSRGFEMRLKNEVEFTRGSAAGQCV